MLSFGFSLLPLDSVWHLMLLFKWKKGKNHFHANRYGERREENGRRDRKWFWVEQLQINFIQIVMCLCMWCDSHQKRLSDDTNGELHTQQQQQRNEIKWRCMFTTLSRIKSHRFRIHTQRIRRTISSQLFCFFSFVPFVFSLLFLLHHFHRPGLFRVLSFCVLSIHPYVAFFLS